METKLTQKQAQEIIFNAFKQVQDAGFLIVSATDEEGNGWNVLEKASQFKSFEDYFYASKPEAIVFSISHSADEDAIFDRELNNNLMKPEDIKLVETCGACPEQYDAFVGDKQVGYLRLRHGWFRVDVPDCGGETIYEANPKGDGIFESDEREMYLENAKKAICDYNNKTNL